MFFVLYKILFYLNRFINPYFSGKHLQFEEWEFGRLNNYESQSLFYWNPFCNINVNDLRL